MASEAVDLSTPVLVEVVTQAMHQKGGATTSGTLWVDQLPNHLGEPTKRQRRAAEDATAVGGLRTPHVSVLKWPRVAEHGIWLRTIIDGLPGIDAPQIEGAMATLGQDGIPSCLEELAYKLRMTLGTSLGVASRAKEGLQGSLIYNLAAYLGDPDEPVRTWLRDEAVPLGIECPIEPAGIFPSSIPSAADDVDLNCGINNYASYGQHKDGADAILQRELDHDWLGWAPSEQALELRHGPITYSRIGVVAKEKQGRLKLRLIHDLRRSGVNAKVAYEERVVSPRLKDDIQDALDEYKDNC